MRFADDFVVGFEHRQEAERFLGELRERFSSFGLALHPDKTRLIEFGRFAAERRQARGARKPETFNVLGFTHICGKSREGRFTVRRQTMRQRWQAKLQTVATELRRRRHDPVPTQGAYLRAVIRGHFQYYGVPWNTPALRAFRAAVAREWRRALASRSQKGDVGWTRMWRLAARWFPPVKVCHPHPAARLVVRTRGGSRMR